MKMVKLNRFTSSPETCQQKSVCVCVCVCDRDKERRRLGEEVLGKEGRSAVYFDQHLGAAHSKCQLKSASQDVHTKS